MDEEYIYGYDHKILLNTEYKKKHFLRVLRLLKVGNYNNFKNIFWAWVHLERREFHRGL